MSASTTKIPWKHWAAVILFAALTLAVHAPHYEPSELHVHGNFVDQAGYITTARILLDEGEVRSGILFPPYADQPNWRPYMPGHYVALALSYGLLGFGAFSSLLPNLFGYVLTTLLVYTIARKRYGDLAALLAAFLFAWFPPNVQYAFTAMAEETFTAAGLLAFALFLALPSRWRPLGAPFLLALPFFFRETGALYVIPMLLILLQERPKRSWGPVLASGLASVLLLAAINQWQLADGKGSVPMSWVLHGGYYYLRKPPELPEPLTLWGWVQALGNNALRNLGESYEQLTEASGESRVISFFVIVVGACALVGRGLRTWRRDALPLGTALLCLTLFALMYFLYDVRAQKALRSSIFLFPLISVSLAGWIAGQRGWDRRSLTRWALPAVLWAAGAYVLSIQTGREFVRLDEPTREARQYVESLGHDDEKMLLVDIRLGAFLFDYAVTHYPVPWTFVPTDLRLLEPLQQHAELGTVLVYDPRKGQRPPRRPFRGLTRLSFTETVELGDANYLTGRKTYLVYTRR